MGDMTKNFSRSEFACKGGASCCGGAAPISDSLVAALQMLRDTVGQPLTVNSGFRCPKHNARVGGAKSSQHLLGKAADIAVPPGWTAQRLADVAEDTIEAFQRGGIIMYDTFVHFDVRGWNYREDKRTKKG